VPFNELSNALFAERQLLELLVFKLDEEQLLLATGRERWLAHATREVEAVLDQIRRHELVRAVRSSAVATALGLDADATLRQIATAADGPWQRVLSGHREALERLVYEVNAVSDTNRELLGRGQAAAAEAVTRLGVAVDVGSETYSHEGAISRSPIAVSGLVNRAL